MVPKLLLVRGRLRPIPTNMSKRHTISLAAVTVVAGAAVWADSYVSAGFAILVIAAVLDGAYTRSSECAEHDGTLLPSFALELAALLLFDTTRATAIVILRIVSGRLAAGKAIWPIRRAVTRGIVPIAAIQAAGATYSAVVAAAGPLAWPARSVPIVAAITSYCLVTSPSCRHSCD